MKIIIHVFAMISLFLLSACNGKTDAEKQVDAISQASGQQATETKTPDQSGIYMSAIIDGKKWVATKMIPDLSTNSNYKQIHGETSEFTISFQIYKPASGVKEQLSENNASNLITDEDYFSGKKGQVEVTKMDDKWLEGTFHFSATNSRTDKVYEVTNGFFRVQAPPQN
jgi:hypothetical protein